MRDNKTFGIGGKGYYIALVLCAAAIGIAGYVYQNNQKKVEQVSLIEQETVEMQARETVPAAATEPATTGTPRETAPETTAPQAKQEPLKTGLPVQGDTAAVYSMDALRYNETTRDWRVHNGVDYGAEAGAPVLAAAEGTVTEVKEDDLLGVTVVLRHAGGYETTYSNLQSVPTVAPEQYVSAGQVIGAVGATSLAEASMSPHLHFSVTKDGEIIDPQEFLKS